MRREMGEDDEKKGRGILIFSLGIHKDAVHIYTYYMSYIMYHRTYTNVVSGAVGVCMYVYVFRRISGYGNEMARRLGSSRRVVFISYFIAGGFVCTKVVLPAHRRSTIRTPPSSYSPK